MSANLTLRYRVPGSTSNQMERFDVPRDLPLKEIYTTLSKLINKAPETFDISFGQPPKPISDLDQEKPVGQVFGRGEVLTTFDANRVVDVKRGKMNGKYIPPIEIRNSIFVKHDVPGDNSCLFHSVGWIFDKPAQELRKLCAEVVLSYPEKYTAGFLGSQPRAYAEWIQQPSSWGGAIEIDLLANVNQCEICVLDMTSKKPQIFGQGNDFTVRAYVVYTGNHYDAAGVGDSMDGGRGSLVKQFSSSDKRPLEIAQDYLDGRVKAVAG